MGGVPQRSTLGQLLLYKKAPLGKANSMLPTKKPIIALAPMDGVTDRAYRQIVRRLNPGVWLYSEFTSINGIEHSAFVRERLKFENGELPFFVQIFGREPELFAKIIAEIQDLGIKDRGQPVSCQDGNVVKDLEAVDPRASGMFQRIVIE